MKTCISFLALFFLVVTFSQAQQRTNGLDQRSELGLVSWYRDYDAAIKASKSFNKPVFILFQEVPGCATCRNYGKNVLSNVLMSEFIENEFIPLAIYNNKGGKDAATLKKYNEPSWNNPVVRIVDKNGKNLTRRIAGDYTATTVFKAMNDVLKRSRKSVPKYVQLLGEELSASSLSGTEEKIYSMYCYWSGEKNLGAIDGVVNTEAGYLNGKEVVKVTYDPIALDQSRLKSTLSSQNYSLEKKTAGYRTATNDDDYYLRHTNYKYLPLTDLQKTKINSLLGQRKKAHQLLSPKQLILYTSIVNNRLENPVIFYNKSVEIAWTQAIERVI